MLSNLTLVLNHKTKQYVQFFLENMSDLKKVDINSEIVRFESCQFPSREVSNPGINPFRRPSVAKQILNGLGYGFAIAGPALTQNVSITKVRDESDSESIPYVLG
jgi:hypothetical protein